MTEILTEKADLWVNKEQFVYNRLLFLYIIESVGVPGGSLRGKPKKIILGKS